jgi:hypothetical protein
LYVLCFMSGDTKKAPMKIHQLCSRFLCNKNQLDAPNSQIYFGMKLYMFRTVPLSIIRSLFTVHSAMVYVIQVCRQLSSRSICSCSKVFITKKYVTMHGHMNVKYVPDSTPKEFYIVHVVTKWSNNVGLYKFFNFLCCLLHTQYTCNTTYFTAYCKAVRGLFVSLLQNLVTTLNISF